MVAWQEGQLEFILRNFHESIGLSRQDPRDGTQRSRHTGACQLAVMLQTPAPGRYPG